MTILTCHLYERRANNSNTCTENVFEVGEINASKGLLQVQLNGTVAQTWKQELALFTGDSSTATSPNLQSVCTSPKSKQQSRASKGLDVARITFSKGDKQASQILAENTPDTRLPLFIPPAFYSQGNRFDLDPRDEAFWQQHLRLFLLFPRKFWNKRTARRQVLLQKFITSQLLKTFPRVFVGAQKFINKSRRARHVFLLRRIHCTPSHCISWDKF